MGRVDEQPLSAYILQERVCRIRVRDLRRWGLAVQQLEVRIEELEKRVKVTERDDGSLETVGLLAGRLYKNVKGLGNEGVGHISLAFTEKDGRRGAVIVLAPDEGNEEITQAVEAIYDRQDAEARPKEGE